MPERLPILLALGNENGVGAGVAALGTPHWHADLLIGGGSLSHIYIAETTVRATDGKRAANGEQRMQQWHAHDPRCRIGAALTDDLRREVSRRRRRLRGR